MTISSLNLLSLASILTLHSFILSSFAPVGASPLLYYENVTETAKLEPLLGIATPVYFHHSDIALTIPSCAFTPSYGPEASNGSVPPTKRKHSFDRYEQLRRDHLPWTTHGLRHRSWNGGFSTQSQQHEKPHSIRKLAGTGVGEDELHIQQRRNRTMWHGRLRRSLELCGNSEFSGPEYGATLC